MSNSEDERRSALLQHIDSTLMQFDAVANRDRPADDSTGEYFALMARVERIVRQVTGPDSDYVNALSAMTSWSNSLSERAKHAIGLLRIVRDEVDLGILEEMIVSARRRVFSDFVEMASYFVGEDWPVPAVVILGATLESHLRQLCVKNEVPIEKVRKDGRSEPLTATPLNQSLYSRGILPLGEFKMADTFITLRNSAAHGHADKVTLEGAEMFLNWLPGFMERYTL